MEKKWGLRGFSRLLGAAALALFLCIVLPVAVASFGLMAQLGLDGPYEEWVDFVREGCVANLLLTAAAIAALCAVNALLVRFARIRLSAVMMALWLAAALFWVIGIGLVQERDCEAVLNAAKAFAQGDYAFLKWGYFMGCPFQLGIVLIMEGLTRLLPGIDLNILMQCINAVCGAAIAGVLAALSQTIFDDERTAHATMLLCAAFLPFLLFCVFTYGTMLMLLCCMAAILCFARYAKSGRRGLLAGMALFMAAAYVAKPNALIPGVALCICALLHAMGSRDVRPLLAAALGVAVGLLLMRLIIWQYGLRSGEPLVENVHILTWLMMGIGEPASQPGWYNGYVGVFFDMYLAPQEQKEIVMRDLAQRIPELLENPAMTAAFMRDKFLSQWLEPTYSTMIYGERCFWSGRFNGLAALLYRPGSPIHDAATAYMNVYQQAVYVLACVGAVSLFRRRGFAPALVLPVIVIGGFLYHQLFEAKSQYIFPYIVYMMPPAAQGLCIAQTGMSRAARRMPGRGGRKEAA